MVDELIKKLKKKDENAFEEIYKLYYPLVFYVINKILMDDEASKDLTQDTFLTMYYKINQYSGGNFKYWLLQIAKRKAINYLNKGIRERKVISENINKLEIIGTEEKDFKSFIDDIGKKLDEKSYEIVIKKIVFKCTFKEIANEMGLSLSSVYRKYKEAIKKIQKDTGNM